MEDVLAAVGHVHVSGMMHEKVLGDIGRWEGSPASENGALLVVALLR